MSSQSPSYYIILSGVVAALISGCFSLWRDSINDKLQLEREEQQRIWQEKSEQQKWYREKTYDCYRKSIDALKKIIQIEVELKNSNITIDDQSHNIYPKIHGLCLEFVCELDIIIMGHPSKNSEEFQGKISTIKSQMEKNSSQALILIIEMMEYDPRIKDINKTKASCV